MAFQIETKFLLKSEQTGFTRYTAESDIYRYTTVTHGCQVLLKIAAAFDQSAHVLFWLEMILEEDLSNTN